MHTIRIDNDVSTSTPGFPYFSILLFLWRKTLISMQEIKISMQEDRGREGKAYLSPLHTTDNHVKQCLGIFLNFF